MFIKRFLVLLNFLFFFQKSSQEKIIIDTDPGVDDAIAIFLMLRFEANQKNSSQFEVIGITSTHGNVEESIAIKNILKILTIADRSDIPIYSGANKALIEKRFTDNFFGNDGFGDVNLELNITAKVNKSKRAVDFLIDMANEHAGNISIVSIGPLTNIGMAIALDQNFTKNVNQFYVMGGSISGIGNVRPNVEFNLASDPESAYMLFNTINESKIALFPWEAALSANISLNWRKEVLGKYNSSYIDIINKIESISLAKNHNIWTSSDAMAIACLIEPSMILSQEVVNVSPVLDGVARGSLLVDYGHVTNESINSKIVVKVNETVFQDLLIQYLTCDNIPC